jgi:hypothetical protein
MARTSNDDRSDTMNPNNDAYSADQENRFGDPYDDAPAPTRSKAADGALRGDARFGPDPHPILGLRANRLPASAPEDRARVPWTESLAILFATPESEARDRKLATEELMTVSASILEEACRIIVRQGNEAMCERAPTGEKLTLTYGRARGVVVRAVEESNVVLVELVNGHEAVTFGAYRFAKLRWRNVHPCGNLWLGLPYEELRARQQQRAFEIGYDIIHPHLAYDPSDGIRQAVATLAERWDSSARAR